ncbi:hypothetical protein BsWGS_23355 [Bradybaena similaris]
MSSSEPVFTARSSFKQNGDVAVTPIRATLESIKSVHENPFYKNFGIKHSAPPYPRQVTRSVVSEEPSRVTSNGRSSSVEDDIGEYRPGSGYVHKLLDKFSSLTVREEQVIHGPHLKRSSSLDELPVENEVVKDNAATSRIVGLSYEKPSFLSAAKLSQRARSIEGLNHSHHKYHPGIAISHQHVDTKWEMDKHPFTHKFQRDSQVVPLDVDLVRDDINIENTKSTALLENVNENESYDETATVVSGHESVLQDELPKPNTVLTVRNIFESASSGIMPYTRRQRSDSPSFVSMQSVKPVLTPLQESHTSASSHETGWIRNSSRSSSPLASPKHTSDAHAKPTSSSLSKAENIRQTTDSDLSSRSNIQKSVASISSISGMSISRPQASPSSLPYRTNATPTSPSAFSPTAATDGRLFRFDRENSLEASGTSDSLHHSSSPSASSTKVTVTGVQLYTSALSSQKSSHAVGSSSFKDKHEDGKHYEHPVMIFEKSNLSPKKSKPQRIRDYTPINDGVDAFDEETQQSGEASHSKEMKAHFEDTQSALETANKVMSQKRTFKPNSKISDKNTSNQSKSVPTRNQTIAEVKSNLKSVLDHEQSNLNDKSTNVASVEVASNSIAIKKSNVRKPVAQELSASAASQPVPVVNNFRESKKRVTFAATPKVQEDDEKSASHSPDGIPTSQELILDSLKETTGTDQSYQSEPPAVNEQPLSGVSNADNSQEQPVKGIPSIIAQRLKKQNFDPSQVAEDVLSSPDASEHLNEASKKHLGSASGKAALLDNNETASLSTEIENEISNVRKKMEESRSKSAGLVPIFDSSLLTKKRKEKKKLQASASEELVPALDLSGVTDSQGVEYQPPHKKIAPCNIVFIGENAKTSRSLLIKQRKIKINIHFNDAITETFEYPNEAIALEHYLEDHPHEQNEILVLEDFTSVGDESSDDVEIDVFETPVTPRGSAEDDHLKSNTSLAHTGSLQSYRGRFQQDYELGSVQVEEPSKPVEPEPVVDPDKLMLRPAEEDDTNTWSTSSSSDILF